MTDPTPAPTGFLFELTLAGDSTAAWQHYRLEKDGAPVLVERARLAPRIAAELVRENARPRSSSFSTGLLVVLRGVNLNPGADPEDMVSVRAFLTPERIVTVARRRVMAIDDIAERLRAGQGPTRSAEFLVLLAERLVERMRPALDELEERAEELERRLIDDRTGGLHTDLAELRRNVILLRRHLAPQRDALLKLHREPPAWIDADAVSNLREVADRTVRFVEHLDSVRDQGTVLHDELDARTNAKLNRNLYMMTVVASVFLPLSFVTGLLGINVGGMPGVEQSAAFWIVVASLVVLLIVEVWLLRRYRIVESDAR